jgi:RNA polymerase sigma factor (sigma-70 family)
MEPTTTLRIAGCLNRIADGDDLAREELLLYSCDRLRALAAKMARDFPFLGRSADADDVLQNALIRLHRSLRDRSVESPRQFFALASLQIRRELIDMARQYRGAKGQAIGGETPPNGLTLSEPATDSSDSPSRIAEWTELHQCIAELPDEDREIFDLLLYQELTQQEASDLLDVSLRTIKRRWQTARLRLHHRLSSSDNGPRA